MAKVTSITAEMGMYIFSGVSKIHSHAHRHMDLEGSRTFRRLLAYGGLPILVVACNVLRQSFVI